jgi:large conductance mechanosensitive channel
MKMLKEFKTFILRGNVVDLAVGIVIGAAFGAVVTALVKDLITPLVGILGKFDFSALHFVVNKSNFLIGDFLNAVVSFVILAAVIFFFVVRPVNTLVSRNKKEVTAAEPTTKQCSYCASEIAIVATRCPFCTSVLSEA